MASKQATSAIVVQRDAFLPALALCQRVVERRNTISILSNLLIRAEGGTLTLQSTDLDMQVSATIACTLAGPSVATTLPAASLHDIVRKLPDKAEINLTGDASQWTISAGRSKFKLPCLPASDMPEMPTASCDDEFVLSAETLKKMVATVSFAISTEETRYYLNGIHWHRQGEKDLIAVATDGHRLSRLPIALAEALDLPTAILPRKLVNQLSHILPDKGDVRIGLSESKVSFRFDDVTLVSKLLDGTFPDYMRVVPTENGNRFLVDRQALFAAIDRVNTVLASGHAVKFTFADGETTLSVVNPDTGSAEETVATQCLAGEPVTIGFNGRYCLDMLSAATSENVVFELGDAGSPARILQDGADDTSPWFVIMPMRV